MGNNLSEFFKVDETAFYTDNMGVKKFRSVRYDRDRIRNNEAIEQSKLSPVETSKILYYANEFLNKVRLENGSERVRQCETIELEGTEHLILDNGIIVSGCRWKLPVWSDKKKQYISYDPKYKKIKEKFNLEKPQNIVWFKFTKDGHLGVVARSFDINFDIDNSSGILVEEVQKQWNENFVMIFPLDSDILNAHNCDEIELGIGMYLISKGVPIIDFFSHNN